MVPTWANELDRLTLTPDPGRNLCYVDGSVGILLALATAGLSYGLPRMERFRVASRMPRLWWRQVSGASRCWRIDPRPSCLRRRVSGPVFPIFLLGALGGADGRSVVQWAISRPYGRKSTSHAILAVGAGRRFVTYGGVSLFVARVGSHGAFAFKAANIPNHLMPAAELTSTFTMSALPCTPSIQNAIPMTFLVPHPLPPGLGVIASSSDGVWHVVAGGPRRGPAVQVWVT